MDVGWVPVVDLDAYIGVGDGREVSFVSLVGGKYVPGPGLAGLFGLRGEEAADSRGAALDSFLFWIAGVLASV